jgi:hypothetical protein
MKTMLTFLFALCLLVVGSVSVGYSSPDIDQNGLVYDEPNESFIAAYTAEVSTSLHCGEQFLVLSYHADDSCQVVYLTNSDHADLAYLFDEVPIYLDRVLHVYISTKKLHKGKYRNKVPLYNSYGYHPNLREAPVIHVS